jgi:hypothetical protein
MENDFKITSFFLALLTLINCFVILVIIWSCYHSIDMSDESYYYLGYAYFNNNPDLSGASFHLIFSRFFSSLNLSLPEVRLLRLFFTVLASLVIYLGLQKVIVNRNKAEKFILYNVVLSGMLLSYAWAPLALSYNSMSSILISLIIGLWLLNIKANKLSFKVFYSFIIGALFAILFFVKITNIILLPIIIVSTLYWLIKQNSLNRVKIKFVITFGVMLFIGMVVALQIISQGVSSINPTLNNHITLSLEITKGDSSHSIEALLLSYYVNFKWVLLKLMYPLTMIIVTFFTLKLNLFKFREVTKPRLSNLFKIFSALIFITTVILNDYWLGGSSTKYQILNCYILIWFITLLHQLLENKKIDFILLLGLLSVPISGALGTNNGLSAQFLFYAVFIFLGIYVSVYSAKNMYYKYSVLSTIVLFTASQVISATVFDPYRQPILTNCNYKLKTSKFLNGLRVDKETYKLSTELAFLEKKEAKYLFAYSHQIGMAMLINKKPYSLSWFNEASIETICSAINKSRIKPRDIIFLLPSELPLEDEVISCLENSGIYFNTDYFLEKQIKYYDYVKKKESTLNVYLYIGN